MLNRNIPCFKCGCTETDSITKDTINHIACEVEIVCHECGNQVNYWAYGAYMEPCTLKELLGWGMYPLWLRLEMFFKGLYLLIKFRRKRGESHG